MLLLTLLLSGLDFTKAQIPTGFMQAIQDLSGLTIFLKWIKIPYACWGGRLQIHGIPFTLNLPVKYLLMAELHFRLLFFQE